MPFGLAFLRYAYVVDTGEASAPEDVVIEAIVKFSSGFPVALYFGLGVYLTYVKRSPSPLAFEELCRVGPNGADDRDPDSTIRRADVVSGRWRHRAVVASSPGGWAEAMETGSERGRHGRRA